MEGELEKPHVFLLVGLSKFVSLFEADWEDMTGSTPLEVNKDVVHFTTKVSALFWILVIHDQQRSFPFYLSMKSYALRNWKHMMQTLIAPVRT